MPGSATHAARTTRARGVGGGAAATVRRAPAVTRPTPVRRRPTAVPRRSPHPARPRHARSAAAGAASTRPAGGVLDRLLRGRGLIVLVGALLAGIVFMNVHLLELNGGIGAMSERAADLRRQNADLRLDVARLGSSERVQRLAAEAGFTMPRPGEVTYLEPERGADARHAARGLDRAEPPAGTAPPPDASAQLLPPPEPAG